MNDITLDAPTDLCDAAIVTAPVPRFGTDAPCVAFSGDTIEISKTGWGGARANSGGARPGAGRKPKQPAISTYAVTGLRWYCIRTEYGAETEADVAIRGAGFQTLYPLLWVPPVAARRTADGRAIPARSERLVPLLPRYLLVRFDLTDPSWRDIPTMRGVERLFSTHPERPTPVPESDVTALIRDLAPNGALYPAAAALRDKVKKRWVDMTTALRGLRAEIGA